MILFVLKLNFTHMKMKDLISFLQFKYRFTEITLTVSGCTHQLSVVSSASFP